MNILIYKCRRCGTIKIKSQGIGGTDIPKEIDHQCPTKPGEYGICDLIGYDDPVETSGTGTDGDSLGVVGADNVKGVDGPDSRLKWIPKEPDDNEVRYRVIQDLRKRVCEIENHLMLDAKYPPESEIDQDKKSDDGRYTWGQVK